MKSYALPSATSDVDASARLLQLDELLLPFWGGRKRMPVQYIVRLEGEGNYTRFFFRDGSELIVSLTLKRIAERLPATVFARSHKKNIINLLYLCETSPRLQPYEVSLANGDRVEVSRRKATEFYRQVDIFHNYMRSLQPRVRVAVA